MHKRLLILVVVALISTVMMATPTTGAFSFTPSNLSVYSPPGPIGGATSIKIPASGSVIFGGGTDYFDPASGGDPVANGAAITLNPATFWFGYGPGVYLVGYVDLMTWNGGNSTFSADKMFVEQTHPPSETGSLTIHFYGLYNDAANNYQNTGELIFAGPQYGTSDKANFTGTFNIPGETPPPSPVPEPTTMILMGSTLVSLGMLRRLAKS